MEYSISQEGGDRVLSLSGRFVFQAQREGESALDSLCAQDAERFVIDFEEVDGFDSTGLGLLMIALELANGRQRLLVLRNLNDLVRHTLKLAQVTDRFVIE